MKKSWARSLAAVCGTSVGAVVVLASPSLAGNAALGTGGAHNLAARLAGIVGAASTQPKVDIQAEVLPAATFAVGTSLSGGPDGKNYGVGLTANDISNAWTTCSGTCTLDFVFFVLSNQDESAKVTFKMVSPTGGTVYAYTWPSKLVSTNWFAAYAKGDYSTPGTYLAEVLVNGSVKGWAPVVFTSS
ncbi:MAG TPA: hypothetical protein VK425_02840 [Acidimicrobiales bacterium]|nr:hypothetical protein [Acidimicrobiales bacterium]